MEYLMSKAQLKQRQMLDVVRNADPVNRNSTILCLMLAGLSVLYLTQVGAVSAVNMCLLHSGIVIASRYLIRTNRGGDIPRFVYFLCTALTPLVFHFATSKVVLLSNRVLYDEELLLLDSRLLGWLFPSGQLALWVDQSSYFHPLTFLGRLTTEVLQITYVSYYLWANLLLLAHGFRFFYGSWRGEADLKHRAEVWRRIECLLCAISGAYLLNFFLNWVFPAVSPRLFIADRYTYPLKGFYFGAKFQGMIKNAAAQSFGAFPSGHVGITWLAALCAEKVRAKRYSRVCTVAAVLMTTATIYLRYHYLADAIGAISIVQFGLWLGFPEDAVHAQTHAHQDKEKAEPELAEAYPVV